jgi:hypothetical protein
MTYNFYTKIFSSSYENRFFISEISDDRTEIRVNRQDVSNTALRNAFFEYEAKVQNLAYYPDFLLNFGDNKTLIGVNLLFASSSQQANLFVKLYEPLPSDINLKDTFWMVTKLAEPTTYNVTIEITSLAPSASFNLRGPNYNVDLKKSVSQATELYNYNTLFGIGSGSLATTSSFNQIKSLLQEKSIDVNVDYRYFKNFIHFSSAVERISNFAYKMGLIESASAAISSSTLVTGSGIAGSSLTIYKNTISNITENFDDYEYYLYYRLGETTWPKELVTGSWVPYSVTSSQVTNWLGGVDLYTSGTRYSILYSASLYDQTNSDNLFNALPAYVKEDSDNNPAFAFVAMLGQHFDNLYAYYKDITTRYQAENSLELGISKDVVADALKGLGIDLYTNSNLADTLYNYILGIGPDGNVYTSFTSGSELITTVNTYGTGSLSNQDIQAEIYKRIYHNLPYLLKTKGTERGLRALIACYGIPDTVLRVSEFGGTNDNTAYGAYTKNTTFGALYSRVSGSNNTSTASVVVPWSIIGYDFYKNTSSRVPDTVQFRFNSVEGHPTTNYGTQIYGNYPYSHSAALFHLGTGSTMQFGVNLTYVQSQSIQASSNSFDISGSEYENYAYMKLYLSGTNGYKTSSGIYLPFYDSQYWWNLYIYRETSSFINQSGSDNRYWIYVATDAYNAQGNPTPSFVGSASIFISGATESSYNASWNLNNSSSVVSESYTATATNSFNSNGIYRGYLGGNHTMGTLGIDGTGYAGLYQDFRYWRGVPSLEARSQHTIYPNSIVGSTATSSLFDLVFRIKLNGDTSVSASYFGEGAGGTKYVLPLDYSSNAGTSNVYDLTSVHPAREGKFILEGNTFAGIPSMIFFPGSGSEGINGALYSSSFFATQYTNFDKFEILGTAKAGSLQKANNKVFLVTQSILGATTLSPYTSIEKLIPNTSKNSLNIEVAFSPSDQIDDDLTAQLGTFDIDEYIGDPAYLYSGSYSKLDNLKDFYFSKYTSAYNVYDLVRAIKFYDNSLFKMIKDFVPAKANLSAGVVVKPHILERSVVKRNEPLLTFHQYSGSLDTAHISASTGLGVNYSAAFTESIMGKIGPVVSWNDSNAATYTGRFGGSTITQSRDFVQIIDNRISGLTTAQQYATYSLNYLFNNVSSSRLSNKQANLDFAYSATVPVNLYAIQGLFNAMNSVNPITLGNNTDWPWTQAQDSDYNRFTYLSSRYIGSKTSSSLYNTYSINDETIPSTNRAYGKTAAVGNYTRKIGLFTQVVSSSFLIDKNNVALIYLVDESGSFLELNKNNNNWEEVQNTFKLGGKATVKLFDNQKYTDQKTTDGEKVVFSSGYTYFPTLYLSTSLDNKIYFDKPASAIAQAKSFSARNSMSPNGFISGSSNKYPLRLSGSTTVVYNIFDRATVNEGAYAPGAPGYYPTYVVEATGFYLFTASLDISTTFAAAGNSGKYTLNLLKNGSVIASNTSSFSGSFYIPGSTARTYYNSTRPGDTGKPAVYEYGPTTVRYDLRDTSGATVGSIPIGSYLGIVTGSGNPCNGLSPNFSVGEDLHVIVATASAAGEITTNVVGVSDLNNIPAAYKNMPNTTYGNQLMAICSTVTNYRFYWINNPWIFEDGGPISYSSNVLGSLTNEQNLSVSSNYVSFNATDTVQAQLVLSEMTTNNFTSQFITSGTFGVTFEQVPPAGQYSFASGGLTLPYLTGSLGLNTFYLSNDLSNYYGFNFLPFSGSVNGVNSLYKKYGEVTKKFDISIGDLVVLKSGRVSQEYEILRKSTTSYLGQTVVSLEVAPDISSTFFPVSTAVDEILFLTRERNEANVTLNFVKKDGQTSYGIVIPDNIAPDILANIDNIQQSITGKILNTVTTAN